MIMPASSYKDASSILPTEINLTLWEYLSGCFIPGGDYSASKRRRGKKERDHESLPGHPEWYSGTDWAAKREEHEVVPGEHGTGWKIEKHHRSVWSQRGGESHVLSHSHPVRHVMAVISCFPILLFPLAFAGDTVGGDLSEKQHVYPIDTFNNADELIANNFQDQNEVT